MLLYLDTNVGEKNKKPIKSIETQTGYNKKPDSFKIFSKSVFCYCTGRMIYLCGHAISRFYYKGHVDGYIKFVASNIYTM